MLTDWMLRLRALARRPAVEHDIDDELRFHLDHQIESYIAKGYDRAEALRLAHLEFGGVDQVKEEYREALGVRIIEDLRRDIGYALRTLRRSPGFTATALISIALGVGGTTAAFTLLDCVLLRPLPFPEPQRLVLLYQTQLSSGYARIVTSGPNYRDWKTMSESFESMGAYTVLSTNLSGRGEALRVDGVAAAADVFTTLRVQPSVGRGFTADDERRGAPAAVLLSDNLARALFVTPEATVGQTIRLDDEPYEIIGVLPAQFAFPTPSAQLWVPLRFPFLDESNRSNLSLGVIARLRDGVTRDTARADLAAIARRLERAYPKDNTGMGAMAVDLHDVLSPESRMLVVAVFGAAACLLFIACTNLATLLLGRSMARRQELAVRLATGAGRERLVRQLVTESTVLALLGSALGVLVAVQATPSLVRLVPDALPVNGPPHVDLRILAFALLIIATTSLVFGVAVAWPSVDRVNLTAARGRTIVAGRDRARAALVLAEVAGTVTLLVVAALMVKALWRVQAIDPGFRTEGVLTLRTALPMPRYGTVAARATFYQRVLSDVRALPGVSSAAYVSFLPMVFGGGIFPVGPPGAEADASATLRASIRFITPGFFATLRVPMRRGRDLNDSDTRTAPSVTIISESLARRLWPGQDPIGRRINVAFADRTVVGVVSDIAVRGFERSSEPQVYFPVEQVPDGFLLFHIPKDLTIRAHGDAAALALAPAVRRIISEADTQQPVSNVRLLRDVTEGQTAPRRAQLVALSLFTIIAFMLAAVGIHGLVSFNVSRRVPEIGVRLALGAEPRDVLWMFLRQGLSLGAIGVALGIPLAYVLGRTIGGLLFRVSPGDPESYGGAMLVATVLIVTGSLRPALQAARVDPSVTMRAE